jgi:hypothetical protein
MNNKIKSAFKPITPTVKGSANPWAQQAKPDSDRVSDVKHSAQIDLFVLLSPASEKVTGLGCTYYLPGPSHAVATKLSADNLLIIDVCRDDRATLSFLVANLFCEFLYLRRNDCVLVRRLHDRLLTKMFGEKIPGKFYWLSNLAAAVSSSLLEEKFPLPLSLTPVLVRSFSFEVDPRDLSTHWGPPLNPSQKSSS